VRDGQTGTRTINRIQTGEALPMACALNLFGEKAGICSETIGGEEEAFCREKKAVGSDSFARWNRISEID
jgi:hypothetical protein